MKKLLFLALFNALVLLSFSQLDPSTIDKIKQEGLQRSQVMDIAFRFTDVNGPRLTATKGFDKAAQYAKQQMEKWGFKNVTIEPWGDFGKGWELQRSYVAMTAPYYRPMIAIPKAWTSGTKGLKQADIILVSAKDSASLDAYAGKLKGKIIVLEREDIYKQTFKADAERHSDEDLDKMAKATRQQRPGGNTDTAELRKRREQQQRMVAMNNHLKRMAVKEGAIAMLSMNPRGHDGTLFVQGGGSYKPADPENFTDIVVALEDYMPLVRMAKAGIPVSLEMDIKSSFQAKDIRGYNVFGEIPGSDPVLKNEIVMLGGHLDSWHGSTGATDNASGCAVMMEAARIINAIGANPKRTIRVALWSGEEQGLLGSRAYVKKTFGDPATMELQPAHEKLSAYYNLDNGTGKIRGIYLQGNEGARDLFTKWFEPFHDMGAKTITLNNTGGTDHLAFDAVGLPGFQFIQDEIEYDTRTHHTNMDSYDHLVADDLKQAATVIAAIVLNTAQMEQKMPRKELPKARSTAGR